MNITFNPTPLAGLGALLCRAPVVCNHRLMSDDPVGIELCVTCGPFSSSRAGQLLGRIRKAPWKMLTRQRALV
jgi:hypothetical protein